jgi:hypothetical protein
LGERESSSSSEEEEEEEGEEEGELANQRLQTPGNNPPIFLVPTWNNGMEMKSPITGSV